MQYAADTTQAVKVHVPCLNQDFVLLELCHDPNDVHVLQQPSLDGVGARGARHSIYLEDHFNKMEGGREGQGEKCQ